MSDCLGSTGVLAFKGCVVKSRPRWLLDFFFETRAIQSSPPGLSPAQHTLHHHCFNVSGRAVEPFTRLGERARRSSSAPPGSGRVRVRRPRAVSSSCSPSSCDSQMHGTNTTQISSSRSSGFSLSTSPQSCVVSVFLTASRSAQDTRGWIAC